MCECVSTGEAQTETGEGVSKLQFEAVRVIYYCFELRLPHTYGGTNHIVLSWALSDTHPVMIENVRRQATGCRPDLG
jgi:hypothetical protein